jgi:HTH-type transcriptional regulator / antitoxin HigA
MTPSKYKPDVATPPGDTIQEMMKVKGMTTKRATEILDWPDGWVVDVMRGKRPIVFKMADDLARAFGFPPSFWLNLEANYRRTLKRLEKGE